MEIGGAGVEPERNTLATYREMDASAANDDVHAAVWKLGDKGQAPPRCGCWTLYGLIAIAQLGFS
jgi:hypothetical protein